MHVQAAKQADFERGGERVDGYDAAIIFPESGYAFGYARP